MPWRYTLNIVMMFSPISSMLKVKPVTLLKSASFQKLSRAYRKSIMELNRSGQYTGNQYRYLPGWDAREASLSFIPTSLSLWGTYQLILHVVSLSVFPANVSNSLTLPPNHITNHIALSVVMDIMHGELYIIAGPYHQPFPLRIKQFLDHMSVVYWDSQYMGAGLSRFSSDLIADLIPQ